MFLSVDVDVVDPGAAPGTGTPEPGGLTARQLLDAVRRIAMEVPLAGLDVVEVSPPYDHAEVTAFLANRVVLEALSGVAWRRRARSTATRPRPDPAAGSTAARSPGAEWRAGPSESGERDAPPLGAGLLATAGGRRDPSMIWLATSTIRIRSFMAWLRIQVKDSFSFHPSSSIRMPLARSTALRTSRLSSRVLTCSSRAFISAKRPMAISMAGSSSLFWNGFTR